MNKSFRYLKMAFILVVASMFCFSVHGQQIPDLSKINVDDLSDAQIESLISRIEDSGYSEAQLEILARARGMSEGDIVKLRRRINSVSTSKGTDDDAIDRLRKNEPGTFSRNNDPIESFDPFADILLEDTTAVDELQVFGLEFFKRSFNGFEPSLNIAPSPDYLLGPGDQLIIDVWGSSEQSFVLDVSPQGSVFIPNIGPVYINGYTLDRADRRIKQRLKSIYSTLGESSYAQVSLGQIRTITVNVVGEVVNPGAFPVSSFGSVLNVMQLAGGPTENGSFRDIKVMRGGKLFKEVDLYDLLLDGTGSGINLQDQDVLLVPPYGNRVTVDGAVKRPAIYETKPGEFLSDVIRYAGGMNEKAYQRSISIRRNLENIRTVKTVESNDFSAFEIKSGDMVDVGEIQGSFQKRFRVEGAVNHPGEFEIKEGMKLSEAIELAGGFRGDAYLERGIILRELENFELKSIAFSPKELLAGNFNLDLQEEDLIKLQSIFDLREAYTLSIQGEVREPGQYPFTAGMSVEDLIYLAGGFEESAAKSFVEVARRISDSQVDKSNDVSEIFNFAIDENLLLDDEDASFELQPFDLVVIRRSPVYEKQTIVEIEGEVTYPGKYALRKRNERISDVLERAGGMTSFAYVSGATLIRRTEYYVDKGEGGVSDETSVASKIRREDLAKVLEKDTLIESIGDGFKMQESIGIELQNILSEPGGVYDLILKEGDVLSIPRELQTIRVRGEVLYPSTIRYEEGASFKYFVSSSGGFSDRARKGKAYVIYANGSARKTGRFLWFKNFPEIKPGSELVIPTKPFRRKLSPGEIITMATGIGTIAVLINNLTN
ncbi:MAG: SLBB domain-containing protein [Cytophagales bacterium]|nr:SLBB domain-containing protein [Cytophagales bacterium]